MTHRLQFFVPSTEECLFIECLGYCPPVFFWPIVLLNFGTLNESKSLSLMITIVKICVTFRFLQNINLCIHTIQARKAFINYVDPFVVEISFAEASTGKIG